MDVQKELCRNLIGLYYHIPSGATAEELTGVAARDYDSFVACYLRTAGTNALDGLSIVVGDGSLTTPYVVTTHALGTAVDAVGDYVFLETNAQQIQAIAKANDLDTDNLFVGVQVTEEDVNQLSAVTYIQGRTHYAKLNLTADVIA